VHAAKAAPSSWHWKCAPASLEENVSRAWLPVTTAPAIVVSGGVVSWAGAPAVTKLVDAGVGSTLPARSTARTASVCEPSGRPLKCAGLSHASYGPPSRRHSKRAPASLDENETVALSPLTDGVATVVSGGVSSPGP
jgi:hypothetical protein